MDYSDDYLLGVVAHVTGVLDSPILATWDHTSNLGKMLRLAEHIEWAEKHGNLAEAAAFVRNLAEDEWYHLGDHS